MKETRRFKRYTVDLMKITGRMFANEVEIEEISVDGASLKADMRVDIGSEYRLQLTDENGVISVKGIIERSSISGPRTDSEGNMVLIYAAGMKFTNVSSDEIAKLEHFIKSYEKDKEHGIVGSLKVQIETPEGTATDLFPDYKVKKLGFGGMLIGSELDLKTEDRFPMQMFLPDGRRIKFLGRVTSCLPTNETQYDIGIEFVEMSGSDKNLLYDFIRSLDTEDGNLDHTDDVWSRLGKREQDRK
jgi:hypothetical protein